MTWSLTAHGHSGDATTERILIDRLRLLLASPTSAVIRARMSTQFHGFIDLTDLAGIAVDETEREWE